MKNRINVLLTVDTELSPGWHINNGISVRANLDSSIYGTPGGAYGLPFQLQTLSDSGLKAVFFVESLSPIATGLAPLQEVVDLIEDAGQETQLHVHTEWLAAAEVNPLGQRVGQHMHQFSLEEQTHIIGTAKRHLEQCGVSSVSAFRAGNYGANNHTLQALANNGLVFDSSYNYTYLGTSCQIQFPRMLTGPVHKHGVWEVPVTCFTDRPGGFRHVQLCACSFRELSQMLLQAHAAGTDTFVIVSHSFELINRSRTRANKLVVARFLRLCRFLASRQDLFRTVGFNDLSLREGQQPAALSSSLWSTAQRYAQQSMGRIYE